MFTGTDILLGRDGINRHDTVHC